MRFLLTLRVIVALLVLGTAALAQQVSAPTQGGASVLSKGKIAVLNTSAFQEQIAEYKSKIEALNRQFEARVKEVQGLADRINALENTIKTQTGVLPPAKIAEQTEQVDSLKRDYQRKAEDLQADGNRARDQAFEPINQKLAKFAEDFTAKRGIILLIDLPNAIQSNTVVWFDPRTDITREFISEYNKAHPVPGAAPAQKQ